MLVKVPKSHPAVVSEPSWLLFSRLHLDVKIGGDEKPIVFNFITIHLPWMASLVCQKAFLLHIWNLLPYTS